MQKAELRKQAIASRMALSDAEYQEMNQKLLEGFKKLNFKGIEVVHTFLPIVEKREPNTFAFIEWLNEAHPEIKILVSSADFESFEMSQHLFTGKEDLENNAYGIPEPRDKALSSLNPDMVLVPLLAFDQKGYRIGYGKGFYDRFLEVKSAYRLGISFFPALTEIKDVHLKDIKLDACLTPEGIVYFNNEDHG